MERPSLGNLSPDVTHCFVDVICVQELSAWYMQMAPWSVRGTPGRRTVSAAQAPHKP